MNQNIKNTIHLLSSYKRLLKRRYEAHPWSKTLAKINKIDDCIAYITNMAGF